MKNYYKILILIICLSFFSISTYSENKHLKIKVGYPDYDAATVDNSKDGYYGDSYSYLKKIAKICNWKYDFVECNWGECISRMKSGEIDILGSVEKTPERESYMYFSDIPSGIETHTLWANNNNNLKYKDYNKIKKKKVAVVVETVYENTIMELNKRKNLDLQICYYNSEAEANKALKRGSVDLYLSATYITGYDFKKIDEVKSAPYYFAVSKKAENGEEIIKKLNNSMNVIISENPRLMEDINGLFSPKEIGVKKVINTMGMWVEQKPWEALAVTISFFSICIIILIIIAKERENVFRIIYYNRITGIWNFSKFTMEIEKFLVKAAKKKNIDKYALIHINISKFRYLNETQGYEIGNEILNLVGKTFKETSGEDEFYGSLWADHFVCLVKVDSEKHLMRRAFFFERKLNRKIKSEYTIDIKLKAGVYFLKQAYKKPENDINKLFQHANHALNTITESYKSEIAIFDNESYKKYQISRIIDRDMKTALKNNELLVFYQPKYNVFTNEIVGMEALVRWNHRDKGILMPGIFLPHFERSGFITLADFYVFEKVCSQLRKWIDDGIEVKRVSVNFSMLHMRNNRFPKKISEIAEMYGISPELIEIEITETVAENNIDIVSKQIAKIRGYGFKVAIDDFGSGYSSFSILDRLDIDVVKLDRTFLYSKNEKKYKVLDGLIKLTKDIGLEVICEGVETEEHLELIKKTGCRFVQGFLFSRPINTSEMENLLKKK